jgi:EmrB/QacA subfamily drug resistance transporter
LAGIALFATASLLAGFSQSPMMLIVFRSLQGLGGALLAPAALSLVLTIYNEGKERNRALGIWSMIAGGGGAVGLLLGGILTQYVNWRWIFFINVPIALIVLAVSMRFVPKSLPQERQRVDYTGALTVTASLMSLVYALAEAAQKGWGSAITLASLAAFVVLMAAFIVNELRVRHPLVRLSILKRRNVSSGIIMQLLMPAALFGMFFYLSIYLQQILGYSPTKTGVADLPFTLVMIAVAGTLSSRIQKLNPKVILIIAPLVVAAGLVFFARIPVHANYLTDILPGIVLMAAGMAAIFVTNTLVTTSGVSHKESGLVSGLLNTSQQIGGALGLATLAVVSTATTKHDIVMAHGNPAALPSALVHGFQRGFLLAIVFAVVSSIVALVLVESRKPTKQAISEEAETEAEALSAIPGV